MEKEIRDARVANDPPPPMDPNFAATAAEAAVAAVAAAAAAAAVASGRSTPHAPAQKKLQVGEGPNRKYWQPTASTANM